MKGGFSCKGDACIAPTLLFFYSLPQPYSKKRRSQVAAVIILNFPEFLIPFQVL